jgi:hypothetical protein
MKDISDILDQRRLLKMNANHEQEIIDHIRCAVEDTAKLTALQEGHLCRCLNVGPGAMEPIHYATFLAKWINGCHSARIG